MRVDLLAPTSGDRVGRLSRQIAVRTKSHLVAEGHEVELLEGEACRESSLRDRTPRAGGTAFFGHGQVDQLVGTDEQPLFAGEGAERLRGAWLHAFACDAGSDLATRVLRHGATLVVGYRDRLRSDWSFEALPPRVNAALDVLVTRVTRLLAAGVHDDVTLRRALADDLDALTVAVDAEGADGRVVVFAAGLLADLVVRR